MKKSLLTMMLILCNINGTLQADVFTLNGPQSYVGGNARWSAVLWDSSAGKFKEYIDTVQNAGKSYSVSLWHNELLEIKFLGPQGDTICGNRVRESMEDDIKDTPNPSVDYDSKACHGWMYVPVVSDISGVPPCYNKLEFLGKFPESCNFVKASLHPQLLHPNPADN